MIVPMQKICIAGIKKEKRKLLEFISDFGALEITSNTVSESGIIPELSDELSENEKKLTRTKTALKILKEYDTSKKPLFAEKITVTKEELFTSSDKTYGDVREVVRNKEELEFLKAQKPKFENEKKRLEPYSAWNIRTNKRGTKETAFTVGFFDKDFKESDFMSDISELYVAYELLSKNSDGVYFGFVVHKCSLEEFNDILKKYAFTRISDLNVNSNIAHIMEILDKRIHNTKKKIEHYESNLKKLVDDRGDAVGVLFEKLDKADLFKYVSKNGAFPRKTFSMGEGVEKRYYLEGRRITK